jgi:hypothetical protein
MKKQISELINNIRELENVRCDFKEAERNKKPPDEQARQITKKDTGEKNERKRL